jgi:invasion protein IalB
MSRILSALCGVFALVAASAALAQTTDNSAATTPTTPPQTYEKATHGDWKVMCDEGQTSGAGCFMVQTVDMQETGKRVLAAAILKSPEGNAVLRVTVPLGVLLPKGMALAVDSKPLGEVGFVACFPEGCMTQVQLKPEIVDALKAGQSAAVTIYDMDSKPADIPLSLTGFTAAYGDF